MRLIDADQVLAWYDAKYPGPSGYLRQLIVDAPTVYRGEAGGGTVTNREKLLAELGEMPNERLAQVIEESVLEIRINACVCRDCMKEHGGCPSGDDGACIRTVEEWLGDECRRESLIGKEELR